MEILRLQFSHAQLSAYTNKTMFIWDDFQSCVAGFLGSHSVAEVLVSMFTAYG